MPSGVRVAEVAWTVVDERLTRGDLALLPVGAASKEHGPHLPNNTDYVQAEWLAQQIINVRAVVVWPTLSYGYYPVFTEFPGSISLAKETFQAVVADIVDGMVAGGARQIAILNTGISTIDPLAAVIATRADVKLINVYSGAQFQAARALLEEQSFGGHADEIETSIMLALAPQCVDMTRAVRAEKHIARGRYSRLDPTSPTYNPHGINGDATRATREKGLQLTAALFADVLSAVDVIPCSRHLPDTR